MVELKEFLTRFLLMFVILYIFFNLPEIAEPLDCQFTDFLYPLKEIVAISSTWLLRLFGNTVFLDGVTISVGAVRFTIISACTGVVSFSIFSGLIYATPMKRKGYYLALSFPVFLVWNILRVTLTLSFGAELVELLHSSFWLISIFIVLGLYMLVLKKEGIYLGKEDKTGE